MYPRLGQNMIELCKENASRQHRSAAQAERREVKQT
jgi:hypothetical protein